MKLNTKTVLLDFKGKPILESHEEGAQPIRIGEFLSNILSFSHKNPARSYQLAKKLAQEKEVELKAEDVVFIKEVLNDENLKIAALTAGQAIALLDGESE